MDFEQTLAQLRGYVAAMQEQYPEEYPKPEKSEDKKSENEKQYSHTIPHADAKPSLNRWSDDFEHGDDSVIDVEAKEPGDSTTAIVESPDASVGKAEKLPRYRPFTATTPFLSVDTVQEAIEAMNTLKSIRDAYMPVLIGFIDDKGRKYLRKTLDKDTAKAFILADMQRYQELIDSSDSSQEAVVEEEGSVQILEPTPLEQLNDDESFKGESAAAGLLHTYEGEDHFIVYNEKSGETARWDIYDLENAEELTDPTIEHGYTVTDKDRKKYAKELHKGEIPEEKKKKDIKKEVKQKGKSISKLLREFFKDAL